MKYYLWVYSSAWLEENYMRSNAEIELIFCHEAHQSVLFFSTKLKLHMLNIGQHLILYFMKFKWFFKTIMSLCMKEWTKLVVPALEIYCGSSFKDSILILCKKIRFQFIQNMHVSVFWWRIWFWLNVNYRSSSFFPFFAANSKDWSCCIQPVHQTNNLKLSLMNSEFF